MSGIYVPNHAPFSAFKISCKTSKVHFPRFFCVGTLLVQLSDVVSRVYTWRVCFEKTSLSLKVYNEDVMSVVSNGNVVDRNKFRGEFCDLALRPF